MGALISVHLDAGDVARRVVALLGKGGVYELGHVRIARRRETGAIVWRCAGCETTGSCVYRGQGDRAQMPLLALGGFLLRHDACAVAQHVPPASQRCSSCRAPIRFVRARSTGRWMPLDAKPTDLGNVVIEGDGEKARALVFRNPDDAFAAAGARVKRYRSHFATCPRAGDFRR